jgi:hypothetical protein
MRRFAWKNHLEDMMKKTPAKKKVGAKIVELNVTETRAIVGGNVAIPPALRSVAVPPA